MSGVIFLSFIFKLHIYKTWGLPGMPVFHGGYDHGSCYSGAFCGLVDRADMVTLPSNFEPIAMRNAGYVNGGFPGNPNAGAAAPSCPILRRVPHTGTMMMVRTIVMVLRFA
jgi:hypothetical protein